jgi:hypothetical protein
MRPARRPASSSFVLGVAPDDRQHADAIADAGRSHARPELDDVADKGEAGYEWEARRERVRP